MKHTLGSGPIEPQLHDLMPGLAHGLDEIFNEPGKPKSVGFVLLAFNFGDKGRCNYISNANREDVVTLLAEQLAYFKGMPETGGGTA